MSFSRRFGGILRQGISISQTSVNDVQSPMGLMSNAVCYMSSRVFVGGISYNTDEQSLKEAFSSYGEVTESKIIIDRDTGRSRGFGFVTFADDAAANSALSLDGDELDGRRIGVKIATERPPHQYSGGDGGSGGGDGGYGGSTGGGY